MSECQNTDGLWIMVAYIKTELRTDVWSRKRKNSGLQIKFKRWGQQLVVSVSGAVEGRRCRSFVVVGGFAPAGLNVNNNNYDNDHFGVAALRKSCYIFPAELTLSGGRT